MRNTLYSILTLVSITGSYFLYNKYAALPSYNKMQTVPVQVETIENRFLSRQEHFSGTLQADKSIMITAETAGRIKSLNLTEGLFVKEGTVLVEIENEQQVANLKVAQAQYDRSEQSLEKAKTLAKQGDIPQRAVKDSETEFATAKAKKEEAESIVKKMVILAPFDGVVGLRKLSVGAYLQPNTEIAKFNKLDPLRVLFSVPADRRPYVITDNIVQIRIDNEPLPVIGKIAAKESNLQAYNSLLDVVAVLDNVEYVYLPGQHASVTVVTSKEEEVVSVPENALLYDDDDRVYVFVVKNGSAIERNVDLGLRKGNGYLEVTNGLKAEEQVVIEVGESRDSRLIDGSPVQIKAD